MTALALLLATALVAPAADTASDPLFPLPMPPVGDWPMGVAAGDLNGDGRPDLVSANRQGDSVSAMLGRGDLGFDATQSYGIGNAPTSVVLADLEDDGRLDLITAGGAGVFTLRGQGDGDFETPRAGGASGTTAGLVSADVNGDGASDVLATIPASDTFVLLRGDGQGGLLTPVSFGVYDDPRGLVAADLDLDGDIDVATANNAFPSTLTVRLGDGAGSFGPKNTFQADAMAQFGCQFVGAEDLGGDGLPELIEVTAGAFSPMNSFLNLGGSFGPPVAIAAPPAGLPALLADVNADGRRDLLLNFGSGTTGAVDVRLANGAGGFHPAQTSLIPNAGASSAVEDFDGDGRADLASAHFNEDRLSVLPGDGAGRFLSLPPATLGVTPGVTARLALGDADHDGDLDAIAVLGAGQGGPFPFVISVLAWQGGDFAAPQISTLASEPSLLLQDSRIADLDGDGDPDVLAALRRLVPDQHFLRVALDGGAGAYVLQPDVSASGIIEALALGDVDADGDLDAATAEGGALSVSILVYRNDGAGGLTRLAPLPIFDATQELLLHDLDADGRADLVRSNVIFQTVDVRLAGGHAGFGPAMPITPAQFSADALDAADLDEDGVQDLAWSSSGSFGHAAGWLRTVHGLGGGQFSPLSWDVDDLEAGGGLVLADLNLDGHLDAVCGRSTSDSVFVHLGDGDGALVPERRYALNMNASGPLVADLDADGLPELVGVTDVVPMGVVRAERVPADPWDDLGSALTGAEEPPQLRGLGTLVGGEPITLEISDANALGSAALVVGVDPLYAPFKGGTLVPQATVLILGLPLDAFGHFVGSGPWYPGLPSGTETFFQAWIPDPGAIHGWAASNALRGTSP